jgi:hypothetical protein
MPLLPLLLAAGLLLLLLLLSGVTTAGSRGGVSPASCFCGRLTAAADAAGGGGRPGPCRHGVVRNGAVTLAILQTFE